MVNAIAPNVKVFANAKRSYMNQAMKDAWLQVVKILDQQPSRQEFDAFLRTWQLAMQAEREACCDLLEGMHTTNADSHNYYLYAAQELRRLRGQA